MRDLEGATVVLTRAHADNEPLGAALREHGATVIELPCIDVQPVTDGRELRHSLRALGPDDRLLLTSRAGARAVATALDGEPLRAPLAVVGAGTERVARELGLAPDFRPSRANAQALGDEVPVPRGLILMARSDRAGAELVDLLRARGARVRDVVAYRTSIAAVATNAAAARMACERGAVAVLSSPSAVQGFAHLAGGEAARRCAVVAIGPTTAAHIRQVWRREPMVAERPAHEAIVAAVRVSSRRVARLSFVGADAPEEGPNVITVIESRSSEVSA